MTVILGINYFPRHWDANLKLNWLADQQVDTIVWKLIYCSSDFLSMNDNENGKMIKVYTVCFWLQHLFSDIYCFLTDQ